MNRRNFLKALGLGTSASALSACGLDNNIYYTPVEQLLPYVVRPEGVTPGTPTFFATTLASGPDAHPVLARHRDGRVIHVGVNKRAPFDPAVPKDALFELQKHYSPDRYKGPLRNAGEGAGLEWDEAMATVTKAVTDAKAAGKKVAWLSGYRSGAMASAIQLVCDTVVHWEPLGYEAEALAAKALFGSPALPRYDLREAHYILSFGADLLGSWGGARVTSDFAYARHPDHGKFVARYAHVSPYRDHSAANADDWVAVVPGSEAVVARAIAAFVAKKKGLGGAAVAAIGAVDIASAAKAAGVEPAVLEAVAEQFAKGNAVAVPGGVLGAGSAATELAAATYLLNLVGGAAPQFFRTGGYEGTISSTADLEALVKDLDAGAIGVLFVDGANPEHTLPGLGFGAALAKAGLSVSLSSHPDETTAKCALILPSADAFEDWGTEEPMAGMTLLRQPSMSPVQVRYRPPGAAERVEKTWDVRSAGEILVAIAKGAGVEAPASYKDHVRETFANGVYLPMALAGARATAEVEAELAGAEAPTWGKASEDKAFGSYFNKHLSMGFAMSPLFEAGNEPAVTGSIQWSAGGAPTGAGDYHLVINRHANLNDGRHANTPWAQELPDPMTGQVWDSWVEVHPDTAATLGVTDNSLVSLTTDAGTFNVGVEVTKSVRPDTVALQFGQGHTANGRYANNVGQNAAALVAFRKDAFGAMAWQGMKVAVASTGGKADLVSTFGHDTDEERNFAVVVNAEQLAAAGDAPSAHPGEMTGIHHLELDKRLVKNNLTDFYGLTEHPTYRFGMTVDTDLCNGCGACSVACYAENNLPVVGKDKIRQGREMGWIRINRYFKGDEVHFVPMMCQHCGHAPCESVCPVLATYHNLDGLNAMIYNRCVGTRYCSNACPFSARRFNYHTYVWPEPFNMQLNPDVVTRTMGVMEKCTFCVQRIRSMKTAYKDLASEKTNFNATIPDATLTQLPACAEVCPSQALSFGNLNDESSVVSRTRKSGRNYMPLEDLNVFSAVNYLAKSSFHVEAPAAHHGGGTHGDTHDAAPGHDAHGAEKKDAHGADH